MTRHPWVTCAVLVLAGTAGCARAPVARSTGAPAPVPADAVAGIALVRVAGGCYPMGSAPGTPGGPEEKPAHEVCVDDFYIGRYEVTQGQWTKVMGSNPSRNAQCGPECPVEMVSWNDVQQFIEKLNAASGAAGGAGPYRLPTEAEWEYAARSGGKGEKYAGQDADLGSVAWYIGNAQGTHRVGTRAANGLGVHDMSGNVWEWTGDRYGSTYYASSPRENPTGPASGERRVLRGGSFSDEAFDARACYRNFLPPDYRSSSKGFRLARSATARGR